MAARRSRQSGLTLIETVMASLLLLLITFVLAQLFLSGVSAFQRTRFFSTAAFLTSGAAERLLPVPADLLSSTADPFPVPFDADYQGGIAVSPYSPQFNLIEVSVRGRNGVRTTYSFLKRAPVEFAGVATDAWGSLVAAGDGIEHDVNLYDADQSASPMGELPSPDFPPLPGVATQPGRPAGLAQDASGDRVWVGDRTNRLLYVASIGSPSWSAVAGPTGPGLGIPAGMTTDAAAAFIWVADATNKGIRRYDPATDTWDPLVLLPANGEPSGVATDASGNLVWVADIVSRTVRVYDTVSGGWIDSLAPPGGFSGSPRGVAVTAQGGWLWVADSAGVWRFDGADWTSAPLPNDPVPADLRNNPNKMVLGLATDQFGAMVWLHAKDDSLWVYDSAASTFTQKR